MCNSPSQDPIQVEVRQARPDDAAALAELGATTFRETYRTLFQPGDLEPRITQKYSTAIQTAELADPSVCLCVAEVSGRFVGFVKMNRQPAPEMVHGSSPMQLERIYVREAHLGQGIGAKLLERALTYARDAGADSVWLGVMDGNSRAMGFYTTHGFQAVGYEPFTISSVEYRDVIMERRLS